jgi:hypothetical protein
MALAGFETQIAQASDDCFLFLSIEFILLATPEFISNLLLSSSFASRLFTFGVNGVIDCSEGRLL